MVLTHDCEIDKEFNRRRTELEKQGHTREDAIVIASDDPTLDAFIAVSPLLGYEEVPSDQHQGIRSGIRVGYLPVPRASLFDDEEFLVDLRRVATVDRQLVLTYERLASLTDEARGVLRFKITEAYASRALAVIEEIESMVGRTILEVDHLEESKKRSSLILYLDDGSSVRLSIRRPIKQLLEDVRRYFKPRS